MILEAILFASITLGVALGLHVHTHVAPAARSCRRWRLGGALAIGMAVWSASALRGPAPSWPATVPDLQAWLRFAGWLVAVGGSFLGLCIAHRRGLPARVVGGTAIGIASALAAMLNVATPGSGFASGVSPASSALGAAAMIAGAIAALTVHARAGASLPARIGVAALIAAGAFFGAGAMIGRGPDVVADAVHAATASSTSMLVACTYACLLLLLVIERDARRETSDLSASLLRANEDILEFEQRDPVTLLHHRAQFARRMQSVFERVARRRGIAAVAVLGIEGLTLVNDAWGAAAGDEALRVIAGRLLARVRDTRAGRIGGSELAVVLTRFRDVGELMTATAELIDALGQPIEIGEESAHLSVSAGIAIFPCDGDGALPLTRATHAMHRARRAGRNQVCVFDPSLDSAFERDLVVQSGLHRALSNREFVLYLQPKCAVASGAVVGAEALLRWDSPHDGLIPPSDFIGVAERHGLIKDIGWFVIEEACRMLRRMREAGVLLPISVNLASGQFSDAGLVPRLCETLERHGVSPGSLCLEVTESMAAENAEHMSAVLAALRGLGFRVALDDFGTGYSNLSKLSSLPVDEIKLDRSFIVDIETDARSRSIAEAVVGLAHACGCVVVVEGVETRGQAELVARFGADEAQGYHWHRPMPFADFVDLVLGPARRGARPTLVRVA